MTGRAWPVCGHQRAVSLLSGEIRDRRVRHAYLITGPGSIGKRALALSFATALVCPHSVRSGEPCGECDACRRAGRGTHPDIQIYSLETQRELAKERTSGDRLTVDTVREISSVSSYRAYSGDFRVIILDDAETLTEIAQEALLKTLEEPPPQLVLILLADRAESLLPTIRSRCEEIALSPVTAKEIAAFLVSQGSDQEVADRLSELSQGMPGWAMRALAEPELLDEREQSLQRASEWVNGSPFQRIVRAFDLAGEFTKARDPVYQELDAAAQYWRRVMMNAAGSAPAGTSTDDLNHSAGATLADSYRALVSVTECVSDLQKNVRPRLALEAMVMQWPVSSREME